MQIKRFSHEHHLSTMAGMALDILLAFVLATHDPQASPGLLDAACAEAAAIWRPYGVRLRCTEWSPASAPSALTVVVTRRDRPAADDEPLGATVFDGNGVPSDTLTIFLDAVSRRPLPPRASTHVGADAPIVQRKRAHRPAGPPLPPVRAGRSPALRVDARDSSL
jgi:hypothetical protein